jgi:hypothetical protein
MQISDVANRSQFLKYKKLTKPYQFQDWVYRMTEKAYS